MSAVCPFCAFGERLCPRHAAESEAFEARGEGLETLLTAARKKGIDAERARVLRVLDKLMTGVVLDDAALDAFAKAVVAVRSGEDVGA